MNKVKKNRDILRKLIIAALYVARQEQAFRGHNEAAGSSNRGNFVELVRAFAEFDTALAEHMGSSVFSGGSAVRWNFKSRAVHAIHERRGSLCIAFDKIMTEPGWDKETIAQSASLKQKLEDFDFTFLLGVFQSIFGLTEPLFQVLQMENKLIVYAKIQNKGQIETSFLGNYNLHSGTAQCIYEKVAEVPRGTGVELSKVMGLGSDGASVMTGKRAGVGALLKRDNLFLIQVHCIAHRAALAAVEAANAVSQTPEDLEAICRGFAGLARHRAFNKAGGAIDGCHVRIVPPGGPGRRCYVNRKLFASITLQAVCDHQGLFIDTYVGWPGSVHDARVLRHSPLYKESVYPPPGHFILADGGYPCLQQPLPLITPYKRPIRGVAAQRFNGHHSRARSIIERAFGMMKTRFRPSSCKRWR
ncbi:hypothetical protein NHX12_004814 [Muraenolepis orangiensis]|uniref:DDE Tnp4 domain-containing protein n=1 Tax=Muraenolepis orangiensis TaxID=630683 RepID=A0A9Q0IFW7_9TELE|nr:hypothetical protein NHX12_004814 [Muraenolepis orangiensis]